MVGIFSKIVVNIGMFIESRFGKKKDVLFYIGMHKGKSFKKIYRGYKTCYGFEANPDLFKLLKKEFADALNVQLFNCAVSNYDGEITFNISSNDGASSSIGEFNEAWECYKNGSVKMEKSITVPCVNLVNFCSKRDIQLIDDYISDIQGMDLEVLKTLKPMIDNRKIATITCETAKDSKENIYKGLPDNSESGFKKILDENYVLVAKGWGILKDGKIEEVPDEWWEFDCKWKLK